MSSERKRKFAYCLAIVCLVVATICYSFSPAKVPDVSPVRLLFTNVGGNVLFDHQAHSESYDLSCTECHHGVGPDQTPIAESCGSCHQDTDGSLTAFGENGSFDHDMHGMDLDLSCSECHHTYSEDESDDPQLCSECHNPEDSANSTLSREVAFHLKCIGCHDNNDVTPGKNDCNQCHSPRKKMSALHGQCISCHEDIGSGPSGDDSDCKVCHGF